MPEPLGLFGGTFDPVHFGHLRLAEESIRHLGLSGVRWIPAGQPPHRGTPQVTAQQRLEMVLRSAEKNARFSVDASEVEAAAPSYTVHTLERLRRELGNEQPLVLLVGADAFAGLATWHRWRDIFALAHVAVSHRPGFPVEPGSLPDELDAGGNILFDETAIGWLPAEDLAVLASLGAYRLISASADTAAVV